MALSEAVLLMVFVPLAIFTSLFYMGEHFTIMAFIYALIIGFTYALVGFFGIILWIIVFGGIGVIVYTSD